MSVYLQLIFLCLFFQVFAIAILITLIFKKSVEFEDYGPEVVLGNVVTILLYEESISEDLYKKFTFIQHTFNMKKISYLPIVKLIMCFTEPTHFLPAIPTD